ncbi:MAG: glycosyltransferase family 4 protein [Candidatus Limnocylindria bacterium]
MNVLILNQYALPSGSAGITRHGDIGAELVARGHNVTVIASDYDYLSREPTRRGSDRRASRHRGVKFVWLGTGTYVANDRRRVLSMGRYAISAAWTGLRVHPAPDVVIGSSPQPLAPLAASAVARLRQIPFIFEARDIWPSALADLGAIKRDGLVHRLLVRLERHLYRTASAVVSVPPRGALRLAELGVDPAKCTHIPNGAATDLTEPSAIPSTLDRLLQHAKDRFVLAYAGAIGVPHGFGTLVDALSLLKATRREFYDRLAVVLIGDGVAATPTLARAAALRIDNLRVHPPIAKAAARSFLARADACLMQAAASDHFRYGLSPNKLFDYFAAGKPVLISSAFPTLVDQAGAGIRYHPGDPLALADAIVAMMSTPEPERHQMGEHGRRLIDTDYSIAAITDRYEALLAKVISEHGHG